jgi:hypothetical protein
MGTNAVERAADAARPVPQHPGAGAPSLAEIADPQLNKIVPSKVHPEPVGGISPSPAQEPQTAMDTHLAPQPN